MKKVKQLDIKQKVTKLTYKAIFYVTAAFLLGSTAQNTTQYVQNMNQNATVVVGVVVAVVVGCILYTSYKNSQ